MKQRFYQLWKDLHSQLEGFVYQKVRDTDLAKDLIQEVFIKVQAHSHTLKDDTKVTSWIFQITRNVIADHYRQIKKEQKVALPSDPVGEDILLENHTDAVTEEFAQCILPLIWMLPTKYREALLLSEIEGISQKEMADKLGISYSAVKSRVQRGRKLLKEMLMKCCEIETDCYGNVIDYQRKPFAEKFF
ncbi:RNA polymerase sigma factor SigZ [Negadavirga shengliensis]|uniref:RNA polymerase sigma factor SigZ n=1 Tax=Negadavirga shengliensis TaxID=1389218 RepID=A0ABV9T6Q5_9BACT